VIISVDPEFEEDYDWNDDVYSKGRYWLIEEPYSEIYEDSNYIKILIELPSVRREDIKVKVYGKRIYIVATDREGRDFYKEFTMPFSLKKTQVKAVLKPRTLFILIKKNDE